MEKKLAFDIKTTQLLIAKIARIEKFKGKWQLIQQKDNPYLRELRTIATIQSIGSSTRIEGATMTNTEVEILLKDIKITKFKTRDEQEVGGYFETLELILDRSEHIELSSSNIKALHNQLMKYSAKDEKHKGAFKKFSNKVVANYPDGTVRTIFKTTEPILVDKEMDELLEWTNLKLQDADFHPLICVGTFIYEFLSIHPFQDGNGRLSRLLTTLLLLRYGYGFVQYVSFENIIEKNKKEYYRSLMTAQQFRKTKKEIISDWMIFFFSSLEELTLKLDEKYSRYLKTDRPLNERQNKLLKIITEKKIVYLKDVITLFSNVSEKTLQRDFKRLKSENLIEINGRGNATSYSLP